MEYLKLLSCSPVKNIHLTMVTSPHDNRCILAEDYLLWDPFFRIPSQECAYVSTVVELMEVKAIRYIVHYKLIFVFRTLLRFPWPSVSNCNHIEAESHRQWFPYVMRRYLLPVISLQNFSIHC